MAKRASDWIPLGVPMWYVARSNGVPVWCFARSNDPDWVRMRTLADPAGEAADEEAKT